MADHHHRNLFKEGPDWVLIAVNTLIIGSIVGILIWMATGGAGPAMADLGIWLLRIVTVAAFVVGFVAALWLPLVAAYHFLRGIVAVFTDDPVWVRWRHAIWLLVLAALALVVAYGAALVFVMVTGYDPHLPHGHWG